MQTITDWIHTYLRLNPELQTKLIGSLAIILVIWLLRLLTIRLVSRQTDDARVYYRWRKTTTYLAVVLGIFLIGPMWLTGIQSAATFLGLASAGLAIALKDPLANLAGWAFILWRRPFVVGDRIQIGSHAGDVVDLRIFQFTILEIGNWVEADQSTGRIIHIPNGRVFNDPISNYTAEFEYIWHEIPVLITFESNWQKAKNILQEIADRHTAEVSQAAAEHIRRAARRFMIFYSTLTPTVYTRKDDSGVLLTVRYMCPVRRRRSTEQAIWEDVLQAFAEHRDIEFAYPTQRFYHRGVERAPSTDQPGNRAG
jgi:small-conductance mechanosensitive channel